MLIVLRGNRVCNDKFAQEMAKCMKQSAKWFAEWAVQYEPLPALVPGGDCPEESFEQPPSSVWLGRLALPAQPPHSSTGRLWVGASSS